MPPVAPQGREHEILDKAARRLGLHPFHIPMLRNSVPYNGRPACMRCRWCVGFACEVDAKVGTQNTVLPTALGTGLLELRTECQAREITFDERGRATGVRYFDRNGEGWEQPARVVISSCGAIESARLLLNSANRAFPKGVGNRHDWVGRNLQGHTYTGAFGLFDEIMYDDLGPGASHRDLRLQPRHARAARRRHAVPTSSSACPTSSSACAPPGVPRWGQAHKDCDAAVPTAASSRSRGRRRKCRCSNARVSSTRRCSDHWGIPVVRLSGHKHPHTHRDRATCRPSAPRPG